MSEIYWITRVGILGNVCSIASIFGFIAFIAFIIFLPLLAMEFEDDTMAFIKKIAKYVGIVWVIAILGCIFIPTKKEMLLIYGLGTTIDYIQDNETAKKLPDKAVKALDKYLESLSEEDDK